MCIDSHHWNPLNPERLGCTASQAAWNASHSHPLPSPSGPTPGPWAWAWSWSIITSSGSPDSRWLCCAALRRGTASSVFLLRMSWCFPQVPALRISRVWCRMVNSRCLFIPRGLVSPGTCGWECSFLADLQAGVFGCHLWSSLLLELSPSAWSGVLPTSHL